MLKEYYLTESDDLIFFLRFTFLVLVGYAYGLHKHLWVLNAIPRQLFKLHSNVSPFLCNKSHEKIPCEIL